MPELQTGGGVVAVQLTCKFDTSTFARPYYCLRVSSGGYEYRNYTAISMDYTPIIAKPKRGLNVTVLDGMNYEILASESFDTYISYAESNHYVAFIDQQENGSIIAIAVKDEASAKLHEEAKEKITSLGSTEIYNLCFRNSWSMISVKGYEAVMVETLSSDSPADCQICLPIGSVTSAQSSQVLLKALSFGREHVLRLKLTRVAATFLVAKMFLAPSQYSASIPTPFKW